ncbi:MAG: hydroxyacylglutathione hydrolase [Alphaproteobacteria bacterium]|nr:hydroxyacylglutathione hydrolase [Alphaproteobacteria bacterium]
MAALEVHQIPVWDDNYVYLAHDPETGSTAVIDPAEAEAVLEAAAAKGWKITHILNTHHHGDHTGGNEEIKAATGCTIVGARSDAGRIPGIDVQVGEGDTYKMGSAVAKVFDVPGHTSGHIAYWFEESDVLFCGDTLFALGCGRLFEGTAEQMWRSLDKFRALPGTTRICCAHEYTQANARFAVTVDPDNAALAARVGEIDRLRADGKPTVPSTLAEELATNPFLRADDSGVAAAVGLAGADPVAVFAEVRGRKDKF